MVIFDLETRDYYGGSGDSRGGPDQGAPEIISHEVVIY